MIDPKVKESLEIRNRCPMAGTCIVDALSGKNDTCSMHNCVVMINPQSGNMRITCREKNYPVNLINACDHV